MQLTHTAYEPAGAGPHPTLLTLHGRGANAFDLLGLAPYLCKGKLMIICPQAPLEVTLAPDALGYAWYPMSLGGPPDIPAILSSRELLQRFVDQCLDQYPIDLTKLAVLGFSQGGVMAQSLVLANPSRFAALAVLSSWLPSELVQEFSRAETLRLLPTLVQHGTQDPTIEIARARDSVERLRQLNVPLIYKEYSMGHEIRPKSLSDLSAWLEEKLMS